MTTAAQNAAYYIRRYKIGWYEVEGRVHVFIPREDDTVFSCKVWTDSCTWQAAVLVAVETYLKEQMKPA